MVSYHQSTATLYSLYMIVVLQFTNILSLTLGSSPEGVVVDAMAKLLFYTDNGRNTINVARTENNRDRRIIITYAKHPRTIQIDPMRRLAPCSGD